MTITHTEVHTCVGSYAQPASGPGACLGRLERALGVHPSPLLTQGGHLDGKELATVGGLTPGIWQTLPSKVLMFWGEFAYQHTTTIQLIQTSAHMCTFIHKTQLGGCAQPHPPMEVEQGARCVLGSDCLGLELMSATH